METLSRRQQMILLQLINAKKPITSAEIAISLGVSRRTVISEMSQTSEILKKSGAILLSKRNEGYSILEKDSKKYSALQEKLRSQEALLPVIDTGNNALIVYISRILLSFEKPVKISQLSDKLFISISTLRPIILKVKHLLESFHLTVINDDGALSIQGNEEQIRVAMAEFVELQDTDIESIDSFEQWVNCSMRKRQNIRHAFLKVLRESGFGVRDSAAQRIAMYLVIAEKRISAGKKIVLEENIKNEIQNSDLYLVASNIAASLSSLCNNCFTDDNEISFLAIYLLCSLDCTCSLKQETKLNKITLMVDKATKDILDIENEQAGINIKKQEDKEQLKNILFPILAGKYFDIDGCEHFDFSYEKTYQKSPLCMEFSILAAKVLKEKYNCHISSFDLSILSCFMLAIITDTSYPLKPLHILSTHSLARSNALVQATNLKRIFPSLIESITPAELYELRGMDLSSFDIVLCENVQPGEKDQGMFGYNYNLPASHIMLAGSGSDFGAIYNSVLTLAFKVDECLSYANYCHVHTIDYISTLQISQIFSLFYFQNNDYQQLINQSIQDLPVFSNTAVIFFPISIFPEKLLDLWILNKPGKWKNHKINQILAVSIGKNVTDFELKALETILYRIVRQEIPIDKLKENPQQTLKSILEDSLKFNFF